MVKINKRLVIGIFIISILLVVGIRAYSEDTFMNHVEAEEEYYVGWSLRNVNDSTPTEYDYNVQDMMEIDLDFNFPFERPKLYDRGIAFFSPLPEFAGGGWWIRPPVASWSLDCRVERPQRGSPSDRRSRVG